MIETLRIEGLALVDEIELEFAPGLNVLTGETGAGKSIILGALELLAGGRASKDTLRAGADRGSVEAVFRTEALRELEAELQREGFLSTEASETTDGGDDAEAHELVVARSVLRSGRSRGRVAGQLVPVATLAELFGGRIEVSSQHGSQRLLRPDTHASLLDASGGLDATRVELASKVARVRELDREIARLVGEAEARERRRDFVAFQLEELETAALQPGELGEIDREQRRLANAEELRAQGALCLAALAGDADSPEAGSAIDAVALAKRTLESLAKLDPELDALAERMTSLDAELRDAAAEIERYVDGADSEPGRLAEIEERLGQLERLRRKYGASEDEIFEAQRELAVELEGIDGAGARTDALEAERATAAETVAKLAAKLTRGRKKAAKALVPEVEGPLRALALPDARFEVAFGAPSGLPEGLAAGPGGAETVEFRLSANPGEEPKSLRKVASGGELSRVFLALKNALRRADEGMVLVFDEVDTGVGGRVAESIGRTLAELATTHQVLCITHLPQIAALADHHFRVRKVKRKGRNEVRAEVVSGEERVEEIARMAGGEKISPETLAHARALLAKG